MHQNEPKPKKLVVVLGDQLYPKIKQDFPPQDFALFMAEDFELCTHFKYHKHKLIFFLGSMRRWAEARRAEGYTVFYHGLNEDELETTLLDRLSNFIQENGQDEIHYYSVDDQFFERKLQTFADQLQLQLCPLDSPKFLFTRSDFQDYLNEGKKPFLKTYYQRQRKALKVLLDGNADPIGGRWSFDEANRKKLPKNHHAPMPIAFGSNKTIEEVSVLVDTLFPDHPGSTKNFNWASSREEALQVLDQFIEEKFENFGPYEDAFEAEEVFLYHSTLSPYLNIGLICPEEVLNKVISHWEKEDTHYPSVEGFVRQIIGWREFIRGMDQNYDFNKNHFGFQRKLKKQWYEAKTGIPPLDDSIRKAQNYAYTHHIERLMVIGNLMLMSEVNPNEVYKWFMEMYIDSADWVMAPNVMGMSQFADGGSFATKPYIAGSNYLRKMSHYPKGDWCDIVDGLYWRFIDRQRETFAKNHRMGMMLATLNKMDKERKAHIFKAAEEWIANVTYTE